MDYEKKYKEANDKVAARFGTNVAKEIFTDLYESEDEKIRKELIEHIKGNCESDFILFQKFSPDDVISWLEKQGEQKVSYTTTVATGDGGINALVTRDIEIPFGAKDSELQEANYYIPKGFHAEIDDDKVVIKKGEKTTAWSEEDAFRTSSLTDVVKSGGSIRPELRNEFVGWLKSLKDRVIPQPKHAWSEEDEEMFEYTISLLNYNLGCRKWFKSLKERYTWKPSDEQMQCLLSEVEAWTKGCSKQKVLESLYNDLKKLKRE